MRIKLNVRNFCCLLFAISLSSSCSSDDNGSTSNLSPNIYVVGSENSKAIIWKNGISSYLSGENIDAHANSVFISENNDVYVSGSETHSNGNVAVIWKNGIASTLNYLGYNTYASSVFVSGNDVYVAGSANSGLNSYAILWKNGVPTVLSNSNGYNVANSVFISSNDTYVLGTENGINKIWKNGDEIIITDGYVSSNSNSIFVSNNDVYVVGYEGDSFLNTFAKIWKNGQSMSLNVDDSGYSEANSVFVFGNDVYVVGQSWSQQTNEIRVTLWKNGVAEVYPLIYQNGTGYAKSVFIHDNDVYVVGYEAHPSGDVAVIWKNGIPTSLSPINGNASAHSVFVK